MSDSEKQKIRELGLWQNRLKQEDWNINDYWTQFFLMGVGFCFFLWPMYLIVFGAMLAPIALYIETNVVCDVIVDFVNGIKKRLHWGENYKAKEKVWEAKFLLRAEKENISKIKSRMKFLKDKLENLKNGDVEQLREYIDKLLDKYENDLNEVGNEVSLENLKNIIRICKKVPEDMYIVSMATLDFSNSLSEINSITRRAVYLSESIEKKIGEIECGEYLAILRGPMENLKREMKVLLDGVCLINENSDIGIFEEAIERVCECNKELENKLIDCENRTVNKASKEKVEIPVGDNREEKTEFNDPGMKTSTPFMNREPINNNGPVMNNNTFGYTPNNQGQRGQQSMNM